MSLATAPSAARTHESPGNSSTLSAPASETSAISAVSEALESVPEADAGTSRGSAAAAKMKGQVEEVAEKVFEQREGKEREGGGG
ncbi:MAG: hypothetical protein Q9181_006987, partial [Wetmoreana brouardii]